MKRSRFTEDQIIGILKEHEAGVSVADLCRKHSDIDTTVCNWKAKYGGMDVGEVKRLKGLEDENARLKRLPADAMLDYAALKDLLEKSGSARREPGQRSAFRNTFQSPVRFQRRPGSGGRGDPRRRFPATPRSGGRTG